MKNQFLFLALLVPAVLMGQKKHAAPTAYDLVIGTYTKGSSKGIYTYRFYPESGKLAYLSQIDGISNPSYVCVSRDNKFVYAVNEDGAKGGVTAVSFDANTGMMKLLNRQPSAGADPCYISVDEDRKNAFVANYSSGSVAVLPIRPDGSLSAPSQVIQDKGKGPDTARQEGPHVHTAFFSPDHKYLLYTDLGTDKLNILRYHPGKPEPLSPEDVISVTPSNGPRHVAFSADHKYLYLLQEMGSAITVYQFNGGKPKEVQTVHLLNPDFKGTHGAAAVHITPDGKFLYATDRLDASQIVCFSVNTATGRLTFSERHTTYGKNPRDFAIDPTGKWLIVANQDSDNIVVFKINPGTGSLTTTGIGLELGNPVCLKFTAAE